MKFLYSWHWKRKWKYRRDTTPDMFEYAIQNSDILPDKHWDDALNAICTIPYTGKVLKVVYKKIGKSEIKIITAFWLD